MNIQRVKYIFFITILISSVSLASDISDMDPVKFLQLDENETQKAPQKEPASKESEDKKDKKQNSESSGSIEIYKPDTVLTKPDNNDIQTAPGQPEENTENKSDQTSVSGYKNINFTTNVQGRSIPDFPSEDIGKELWEMRITVPKEQKKTEKRKELKNLINKLQAMKFPEKKKQKPQPAPTQQAEPNEVTKKTEPATQQQDSIEKLGYQPLSQKTLDRIASVNKRLFNQTELFEIAEILFESNNFSAAAEFYSEVLNRFQTSHTDSSIAQDWILFQLGNCFKHTENKLACEYYQKLIIQYPDSPWVEFAKAFHSIQKIYKDQKPAELLDKVGDR